MVLVEAALPGGLVVEECVVDELMGQHVPADTVSVGGVVMALHCAGDAYFRACELAIQRRRPWISGMQKENGRAELNG